MPSTTEDSFEGDLGSRGWSNYISLGAEETFCLARERAPCLGFMVASHISPRRRPEIRSLSLGLAALPYLVFQVGVTSTISQS